MRCPGPLDSCSPVCWLSALRGACAVSLASWLLFTVCSLVALRCVCAVSPGTWLLFTGVPKALLPKGKGRDVYPRVQVNGLGCVCCVRAVCKCVVA